MADAEERRQRREARRPLLDPIRRVKRIQNGPHFRWIFRCDACICEIVSTLKHGGYAKTKHAKTAKHRRNYHFWNRNRGNGEGPHLREGEEADEEERGNRRYDREQRPLLEPIRRVRRTVNGHVYRWVFRCDACFCEITSTLRHGGAAKTRHAKTAKHRRNYHFWVMNRGNGEDDGGPHLLEAEEPNEEQR